MTHVARQGKVRSNEDTSKEALQEHGCGDGLKTRAAVQGKRVAVVAQIIGGGSDLGGGNLSDRFSDGWKRWRWHRPSSVAVATLLRQGGGGQMKEGKGGRCWQAHRRSRFTSWRKGRAWEERETRD